MQLPNLLNGGTMTAAKFEILSDKTAFGLGYKVSRCLQQGWELHGNTWSTGDDFRTTFYQAVIKKPIVIKNE